MHTTTEQNSLENGFLNWASASAPALLWYAKIRGYILTLAVEWFNDFECWILAYKQLTYSTE